MDKAVSATLPEELAERLSSEAQRRMVSKSAVIRWALESFLSAASPNVPSRDNQAGTTISAVGSGPSSGEF